MFNFKITSTLAALAALTGTLAQNPTWTNSLHGPFTPISLNATDGSISAAFVPHGAAITELWVKDRNGTKRDITLGYDNRTLYADDPSHPNFGPIVGRYANRIKNNTYTDPETNTTYYSEANENNGLDTLHGGPYGWSWRVWTVSNVTNSSVSFTFYDPELVGGFPGSVLAELTYSLLPGGVWDIVLNANASSRTPLLLSSHVYWNLDGYAGGNATDAVKEWELVMPYADQVVATDTILIPTGEFINVTDTAYNFLERRPIGSMWNETLGYPGLGGYGYDTCWRNNASISDNTTVLEASSPNSGIKMSVATNQEAIQVYTCGGQNGTIPVKKSQGSGFYEKNSCMVVEMEGVIDAINNPEWDIDQWYSPERPYEWRATYTFSSE
ncbi:galactose mutarotase-like protein [Filobasidium floriforme]|uniref:galactose mutarotase-like protein n=1 Tax=Filobasidium floriforme TaxID=5210 RepID=UPI001E8CDE74|nr:galactose mutarotase-like protein [Filobasidium floriforme]KAH8082172.1 galactose mutarotase-like protein [Filobasidium floriforme]